LCAEAKAEGDGAAKEVENGEGDAEDAQGGKDE